MRLQLGPLPSSGVVAWIAYARSVTAGILAEPDRYGVAFTPELVATFEHYLDEWSAAAAVGPEFLWVTETEPEQVEFLGKAFFTIAHGLARAARSRGRAVVAFEGDEFYQVIVTGFLDALALEGESRLEFSEQLRDEWPGLDPR